MALLRLLFGTEHKDRGRRTVSCQMVPSRLVDRWCCFWSQYLVVLIGQQDTKNVYIRSTSPVAVVFFVTRHSSWAVHEHERTHEDVFRVGKRLKLSPLATKQTGDLLSFTQRGQVVDDASFLNGHIAAIMTIIRNLNSISWISAE